MFSRFVALTIVCAVTTAFIGCDVAQLMPVGVPTVVSDDATTDANFSSSSPTSLRIESDGGVFVLSDAFAAKNVVNDQPGLLAWWKDAVTEEISIWGRLIHTQEDVGHALRSLEYDFGADIQALAVHSDVLNQAIVAADQSDEDPTAWLAGTFANAFTILSIESPALEIAVTVNAQWIERIDISGTLDLLGCQPLAKSVLSTEEIPQALIGPFKNITAGAKILSGCGGGGGGDGDPPNCPGDIDCDSIPDSEDWDIDGDGIPNINDPDVDGDGIPNGEDSDVDGDGIDNGNDPDIDGDGLGNGDDSDADGDGSPNTSDDDIDGDGTPNDQDDDDDGDGTPDSTDPTPGGCSTDCLGACCNTTAGSCSLKSAATCSGANEQFKGTNVVCNLNPCCEFGSNPIFPPSSATLSFLFLENPPYTPGVWGETGANDINVSIDATCDGTQWCAVLNGLSGVYTEWYRLLPTVSEVTGPPPGNTTQQNNCNQVLGLKIFEQSIIVGWFMLEAVIAHENAHAAHLLPALQNKTAEIEMIIEALCVSHTPGMIRTDAISLILATPAYDDAVHTVAFDAWNDKYNLLASTDDGPNGANDQAERPVLDPMIANICAYNKTQCWPVCSTCPDRPTGACCAPDTGVCNIKTECDCEAGGGVYRGDDTTCDPTNPCKGACCDADFNCTETTLSRCTSVVNGTYQGDGTTCATASCGPIVP